LVLTRGNHAPVPHQSAELGADFVLRPTEALRNRSVVIVILRSTEVQYYLPMAEDLLARYRSSFPDIPGWFTEESMFVWDFLLGSQTRAGVQGDFFEIGVYKGRSAVLGALHMRPEDWCVLVDINPAAEAAAMIASFRPQNNKYICCNSTAARGDARVREHFRRCRWVHIDGDHKGTSVANDLELAADLIHENGIICLDDFFNFRYPQLTAATYRFLFDRQADFQMFFGGSYKCYHCCPAITRTDSTG
jgi:hypothetical protein